jgi:hypothetical protein|tara:strand:- start:7850 stop:11227 length:3378 start_codon:yes stop_codon:yes gene_type:complete
MASKKDLQEIQKILSDINRQYKALGKQSPFKGQEAQAFAKGFDSTKDAIDSATIALKAMRSEVAGIETGVDELLDRMNDISTVFNKSKDPFAEMEKSLFKISGLQKKIKEVQLDYSKASTAEIRNIKRKANLEFQRLQANIKDADVQRDILNREKEQLILLGESTKKIDIKLGKAEELLEFATDEAKKAEEKVGHQKEFNKTADKTLKAVKNIKAATGLTGSIIKSLGGAAEKIGFGDMSETLSGVTDKMADHAAALTNNGKHAASLGDQFRVMGTGLAGLGTALMDQLTDPLVILTMIVKAVKFLVGIFSHVLKVTNKIGQSVGLAGKNAENLKDQIHAAGDLSGDMFYNTEEMAGAYSKLNKAAGTNLKFNTENAKTFQDLTLYMGVSEEAAAQLFKISAQTGKSYTGMYDQVRDITQSLNEQGDFTMSTQDAIEAIAQSSGTVRFNIQGGTEGLVKAAHTAARLGLTMADIAAAAETHLDFESSIAKEIEAEMYLQKDLNLDKLRYAALTGNTAMAAEEEARLIKENYKSLKGNVLAQRAFSEATGISMDKLGGAMVKQEELAGLSGQALKDKLAEGDAMEEMGKNAVTFDRTMANLALQFKAMLEPLAKVIGPMIMGIAKTLGPILKTIGMLAGHPVVKMALGIAGIAVGFKVAGNVIEKIKGLFGLGKGKLGSSPMNPMYVTGMGGGGGGGGMDLLSSALGKRGIIGGKFFKGLSKIFGGKSSMVGRTLRNFSAMNLKRSSMLNQVISKGPSWLTKIPGLSKMGTLNSGVAPGTSTVLKGAQTTSKLTKLLGTVASKAGPIMAIADLVIGGFTGAGQADKSSSEQKAAGVEEGIGKGKAIGLGILTGGAEKGSMFSESLGVEKGGAGDEAMGIASAGARGALTGAALTAWLGPGAGIGAAVGGIVGSGMEAFKVFTNPDSALRKGVVDFAEKTGEKLKGWASQAGGIISGFATKTVGDFVNFHVKAGEAVAGFVSSAGESISSFASSAFESVKSLASGAKDMAASAAKYIKDSSFGKAVSSVGSSISSGIGSAWDSATDWMGFADGGIVPGGPPYTDRIPAMLTPGEEVIPRSQVNQGGVGSVEVQALLKELIAAVNKRGDVYLDAQKVGYTLALQSSKM